jgi:hypothetical protein
MLQKYGDLLFSAGLMFWAAMLALSGCAPRSMVITCRCDGPEVAKAQGRIPADESKIDWPKTDSGAWRSMTNIYAVTIPPDVTLSTYSWRIGSDGIRPDRGVAEESAGRLAR